MLRTLPATPSSTREAGLESLVGVGDAFLDVEVLSVLPWRVRGLLTDRVADGRVYLVGDAAHVV